MTKLPEDIRDLLDFATDTLRVSSREGKYREFKQHFNQHAFSRYTMALAAFANTDDGTLIFGVADKPRRIEGIDPATIPDEAVWTDRLRRDFEPEIPFEIREYSVGELRLVAIAVERHSHRPLISKRVVTVQVEKGGKQFDQTVLQQGIIYYRQSGQTRPIQFTELQTLLEERDRRRLNAFLENVEIMQKIGPERVGIVDASKVGGPNDATQLYVSRETAKTLNFIDQGRFVEAGEDGEPAYVVAGTVQLNEVIRGPLDEADKNLPNEAAEQLRPVIDALYGRGVPFTGHHLSKLSRHLGIRAGNESDERYCIVETKLKRAYYTRAGIAHIAERLRAEPEESLRSFASRVVLEAREGAA